MSVNIKELVETIADKHKFDLSRTDAGLLVDSVDSNHGQIFLAPNFDEEYHCLKCAIKADIRSDVIRLTLYYNTQWEIRRSTDDNIGLEIDDLISIESRLNELITKYFLDSHRVILMLYLDDQR